MIDKQRIVKESIAGASKGGIVAAAGSILSGVAMVSVPVKILGLITVGATTAVSAPIVLAVGAGGAVVGGATAAYLNYRKQCSIEEEFRRLTEGHEKGNG